MNLKHVRWWTALTADGSRFEHLAGKSRLMQIPDALRRDPPNRDELLKWRTDDLARMKKTISEFDVEEYVHGGASDEIIDHDSTGLAGRVYVYCGWSWEALG